MSASTRSRLAASGVNVFTMTTPAVAQQSNDSLKQVEWDLTEVYESLDAWRHQKEQVERRVVELTSFKGRLGELSLIHI